MSQVTRVLRVRTGTKGRPVTGNVRRGNVQSDMPLVQHVPLG
jgi:hypothetical protein